MPIDTKRSGVTLLVAQSVGSRVTTVDTASAGRIRQAVRADLVAVVRIERRVFPEPWQLASFEQFLDSPGFLVMEDAGGGSVGDELAGYVVAETMDMGGRTVGHIKDLAVKPERQGAGRGRALLERALAVLSGQGASAVKLEVRPSNDRAVELYRRHGFAVRRRREGYYPDGEDALVLSRQLPGP